jgi:hypothetical protein
MKFTAIAPGDPSVGIGENQIILDTAGYNPSQHERKLLTEEVARIASNLYAESLGRINAYADDECPDCGQTLHIHECYNRACPNFACTASIPNLKRIVGDGSEWKLLEQYPSGVEVWQSNLGNCAIIERFPNDVNGYRVIIKLNGVEMFNGDVNTLPCCPKD